MSGQTAHNMTAKHGLLAESHTIYVTDPQRELLEGPKATVMICTAVATMVALMIFSPTLARPASAHYVATDASTSAPLKVQPVHYGRQVGAVVQPHAWMAAGKALDSEHLGPVSQRNVPVVPSSQVPARTHATSLPATAGAGAALFFAVFLLKSVKKWLKMPKKEPDVDPYEELHAVQDEIVEQLHKQAEADLVFNPSSTVYHLESDGVCMRMPGKDGDWELQPWRGPKYCALDCGEDSFVLTSRFIGVADGVGGWRDEGVDPAIFANQMMANIKTLVDGQENVRVLNAVEGADEFRDHPAMLMHQAYAKLVLNNEVDFGSATCCVAHLTQDGILQVCNLGDSGLLLIRNGECVYRAETNTYSFNAPYQLEVPFKSYNTVVSESVIDHLQVQEGDTIVLASDGLYDNLFEDDIARICEEWKDKSVHDLATYLKTQAAIIGADEEANTPFEEMCKKAKYEWSGGKADDITVVVSRVTTAEK
mmetsp:Transcript_2556/g.4583  ORF Transcript_2556/g.4583 Transcript_2556/m.4583 type:complete len:480 (-) Transcript_2556:2267-3706(-)